MGIICFGLAFQINVLVCQQGNVGLGSECPRKAKEPEGWEEFRPPRAILNNVRDGSSVPQVYSSGPGQLRLPQLLSMPLSIPNIVQHPHFLQATALCKLATGKLERKRGKGKDG